MGYRLLVIERLMVNGYGLLRVEGRECVVDKAKSACLIKTFLTIYMFLTNIFNKFLVE